MPSHNPLTIRVAVLFFLPLIISTELHQLSHSLVHAFLARLGDATITLAAFSIAFAFNTTFGGVVSVQVQAALSYVTDKPSFWRIARFYFLFALVPFFAIEAVALTSLGDWLFGVVIGASPEATRLAKLASAVMGLWIFPNQVRNMATALCMMHRHTLPISYATIIRIVSQALMLMVLPFWMEGAVAGAASLVGCMTVEAIYMYWASRAYYDALPAEGGEQASYRHMWRFSWPLMVTQVSENGVPLVINFFLGRLAHPDLALAAFGVVNALKSLVASPLRNMAQTAQALVHSREDMHTILRFANRVTLVYVVLVGVLFYTPMREVILGGIMGLPGDAQQLRDAGRANGVAGRDRVGLRLAFPRHARRDAAHGRDRRQRRDAPRGRDHRRQRHTDRTGSERCGSRRRRGRRRVPHGVGDPRLETRFTSTARAGRSLRAKAPRPQARSAEYLRTRLHRTVDHDRAILGRVLHCGMRFGGSRQGIDRGHAVR